MIIGSVSWRTSAVKAPKMHTYITGPRNRHLQLVTTTLLNMNIDSVSEVVQVQHCIESLTSNWVLLTSSDAGPSRNAYKDIREVCRSITVTLDDILLDCVEDDDVSSDDESENVFHKEEGLSTNTIFFGLCRADSDGGHF